MLHGNSSGAVARPTVLIVDDDINYRKLLVSYLAAPYRTLEAADGRAALDILLSEPVDLVLMDVRMPGMDGLEACRAIKAMPLDGYLPVLLLTALGEPNDRHAGLEAGADDFLTKPVNWRELRLRTRAFLRLREQDASIRRHADDMQRLKSLHDDLFLLILHDLRNPLMGITGSIELLRMRLKGTPHEALLGSAQVSVDRLRAITDEVLQVGMLEEGKLALTCERVHLRTLLTEAIGSLEGAAKQKGVQIQVSLDGDPFGQMDLKLLRRSIENLLSNALKHSNDGSVVEVVARLDSDAVRIEVADRGPGIPESLRLGLFEKFDSVEQRQGHSRRGHGLGLHLVKLVADAHGGSVSVREREGGGSVFSVCLPQAAD